MAPPIADLTAQAQTLTSAGDLVGARNVLEPALDPIRADPRQASPDLATAAALHARILIALGDPHGARLWAGFAHAAEERLHGPHDERTLSAATIHAAVLALVGNHGRAAQLYHDLVLELTALEGRDSPRVLAAEADLATAEHAAGQCTAARGRLAAAWARHRQAYGDPSPAGIKMLARLGAMCRECGRAEEAAGHLSRAQELCARYLPGDHPLVAQVARLAAKAPSGEHLCGRMTRSTGPAAAASAGPAAAPSAGPAGVREADARATETGGAAADGTSAHGEAKQETSAAAQANGAAAHGTAVPQRTPGHPDEAEHPGVTPVPPRAPEMPPPDNRITDPQGAIYQQPLYLSDLHQPPGDPSGRHARADTPLPMPGRRAPEYTPDGRRVPIGSAPVAGNDPRLPVHVPADPPSSRGPFILAAVLVAGIGVAAAVVAAMLPRDEGTGTAPAPPTIAATAPESEAPAGGAGAGDAPAGVRLRDSRDSVTLSWTYPAASEGPILISGGRQGEALHAFQQLPAGTSDYVVYGLNDRLNYCFTVAVVHSADKVSPSQSICTERR